MERAMQALINFLELSCQLQLNHTRANCSYPSWTRTLADPADHKPLKDLWHSGCKFPEDFEDTKTAMGQNNARDALKARKCIAPCGASSPRKIS